MADRRAQVRNSREEKQQNYLASRERVEKEHQAKLDDWDKKTMEWRERVEALDRQKRTELDRVNRL